MTSASSIPATAQTILVTDDDAANRTTMAKILQRAGYDVLQAASGEEALEQLRAAHPALMFTDLRMPGMSGHELLRAARIAAPETAVILVTAYGTVEIAVEVMKDGAYDFVTKPVTRAELLRVARRALEHRALKVENRLLRERLRSQDLPHAPHGIVGSSEPLRRVMELLAQVAPSRATVLISGASGTGKEQVARAIHELSPRHQRPMVRVACAALPETLLEAELFGHEANAFTGAGQARPGRFEAADGGTLFLDEIGDLSPATQVKLLRVLQEGELERLGSNRTRKVDVRLIAATNVDLSQAVASKRFREDLYYRLNVIRLELPTLAERRGDVPLLVHHFVQRFSEREGRELLDVSEAALAALDAYTWPGNIRELENALERAVILCRGQTIEVPDLPPEVRSAAPEHSVEAEGGLGEGRVLRFSVGTSLKEIETEVIRATLAHTRGDKKLAAKLLGIAARTIYRRLEEEPALRGEE